METINLFLDDEKQIPRCIKISFYFDYQKSTLIVRIGKLATIKFIFTKFISLLREYSAYLPLEEKKFQNIFLINNRLAIAFASALINPDEI